MSKISVTTIAGLTSGGDANKVKIESGDTFEVASNSTVGGTLGVTGNTTVGGTLGVTGISTLSNRMNINFNGSATQAMHLKDTGGGNLASFGLYYNPSNTLIGNIQNANNTGIHLNVGTNGSVVFDQTGYTAANSLDDYEEGTWTPNVGGNATYNHQIGIYTKIGRHVFIRGDININVLGTGSANTLSGLPFSGNYQGTPQGAINVMYYSNVAQNYLWMSGYVLNNQAGAYFTGNNTYATTIQYNGSNIFGNNARVLFSASYTAD